MELTSLQHGKVQEILNLYNQAEKIVCEFKAPTGSGKTLMASAFISELIEKNGNEQFIFVIATPSSSSLPLFFEQKINIYKKDLPYSKFEVEYIQSPSTSKSDKSESMPRIIPEQNKVYIFGKSSFGKGRLLSEYGIIDDFVISAVDKGYKIIYIRDEAHIGGESIDKGEKARNFEKLMEDNAAFILKMTATPDRNAPTKKVILKESELNNPVLNEGRWLLKTQAVSLLDHNLEDTKVLEDAISRFKTIKKEYQALNIGINPAMLIQIDNNAPTDKIKAKEFEEGLSRIKATLTAQNLAWVQYFGDGCKDSNRVYKGNFSLDDITRNNNDIDAVIFKIGPSTGWDIPRACMLVQLRNVSSASLNIQTLGRIKRNPYPNLDKNQVTDKYYIYSNKQTEEQTDIRYSYKVRDKFASETFLAIDIVNKKDIRNSESSKQFQKELSKWLDEYKNKFKQEINSSFIKENNCLVYKKILNAVNGNQIYTTVTNPFIFLRDYKRLLAANEKIYGIIKNLIFDLCAKENIQKEFLLTCLFLNHKKELLDIISKTRGCRPVYKVREQYYDPKSYLEVYSKDQHKKSVSKRDYLFGINEEDILNRNEQPLDSGPEEIVFNIIYDFADEDDAIKIWAKNQISSNIFGEYLDETLNFRKSYFDFIIKFKNGFYLYIEVKGEKDINAKKTELLTKAYADYFDGRKDELFPANLAIAVWKVNDKGLISFADNVFYDRNIIKEDLGVLSPEKLLKTLADLKI